jgi:lysophospholipase L1-like esterase
MTTCGWNWMKTRSEAGRFLKPVIMYIVGAKAMDGLRTYAAMAGVMLMAAAAGGQTPAGAAQVDLRYAFGAAPAAGFTQVNAGDAYSPEKGYGFDLQSQVVSDGDSVAGAGGKPILFSTKLAPGVYRVTVTLGEGKEASETTVKSETRRLMLEEVKAGAGEGVKKSFLVHVRVPQIPEAYGGGVVRMKPRESDPILFLTWDGTTQIPFTELDWDEKLTLEFSGAKARLAAVEIATPATKPTTVYLVGDSTMTDQMMEPWAAWGQMLPRFFREPVVIANYAECGETTASFLGEKRWPKLMSEIRAGDFVLMQFGINDRAIPLERFKQYFVQFIRETREKGATPILVTSQNLKRLDPAGKAVNTLGGYPDAMREVAKEEKTALIDLNQMSMALYEAIGPEGLNKTFIDGTHHSDYGAYELAKCVVNEVVKQKLPFAEFVVEEWKGFDPSKPDAVEAFKMPPDPQLDPARPGGPGAPNGQGPMAGAPPRARGTRGGAPGRAAPGGRGARGG